MSWQILSRVATLGRGMMIFVRVEPDVHQMCVLRLAANTLPELTARSPGSVVRSTLHPFALTGILMPMGFHIALVGMMRRCIIKEVGARCGKGA